MSVRKLSQRRRAPGFACSWPRRSSRSPVARRCPATSAGLKPRLASFFVSEELL